MSVVCSQVHNSRGFTLEEWDMGKHVRSTVGTYPCLPYPGLCHIVGTNRVFGVPPPADFLDLEIYIMGGWTQLLGHRS